MFTPNSYLVEFQVDVQPFVPKIEAYKLLWDYFVDAIIFNQ